MSSAPARLFGRCTFHLLRGRRRRAEERLRRAVPELDAAARRRRLRRAFELDAAARAATRAAVRLGPRELCRRLTLEGFEHLATLEDRGRGVLLMALDAGLWRLAMLVPALYLGPLDVGGDAGSDRLLERLARRLERRSGRPLLAPLDAGDVAGRLAAGGRVGFLAGADQAATAAAAIEAAATVVPVAAWAGAGGVFRFEAWPPVDPGATPDVDDVTRRLSDAALGFARRRPELAVWW